MNSFGQTFANQRSEDDILAHAPIKIQLGKIVYDVAPLPIQKNRAWRGKVAETLNRMTETTTVPLDSMGNFMGGFMKMFFEFPEVVLELVLLYSPKLPRTEIQETATDEEVVVAFSRVMAVAYPFFGLLGTMQAMAKAADSAHTPQR